MKILLGELSGLILGGNKVSGKKITEEGFDFVYKDIKYALNELLSVKSRE